MNTQHYRFEPLTAENKQAWLEVAHRCPYAPMNVCDEPSLSAQLATSHGHVIIYDRRQQCPVAILPGEIATGRFWPIPMRIIHSRFGGLLIAEPYLHDAPQLRHYAFQAIVNSYYRREIKADYLEVIVPPKITIEAPARIHTLLPFYQSLVEINTLLCTRLDGDILRSLKQNVRYEILKGLNHLKQLRLIGPSDRETLQHLLTLEQSKASTLHIDPLPLGYFERAMANHLYHPRVAVIDNRPVAAVIYTYCNEIGTFSFNASSDEGKRLLINKGLLFTAMRECQEKGATHFVLGEGWEHSAAHHNLDNVAFFKRSFSTHEVANYHFIRPLSSMGRLVTTLKQWRGRRRW